MIPAAFSSFYNPPSLLPIFPEAYPIPIFMQKQAQEGQGNLTHVRVWVRVQRQIRTASARPMTDKCPVHVRRRK